MGQQLKNACIIYVNRMESIKYCIVRAAVHGSSDRNSDLIRCTPLIKKNKNIVERILKVVKLTLPCRCMALSYSIAILIEVSHFFNRLYCVSNFPGVTKSSVFISICQCCVTVQVHLTLFKALQNSLL